MSAAIRRRNDAETSTGSVVLACTSSPRRHPNRSVPSYRAWEGRRAAAPFDCSKAKRLLGWHPTEDREAVIAEGIRAPTAEYFGGV